VLLLLLVLMAVPLTTGAVLAREKAAANAQQTQAFQARLSTIERLAAQSHTNVIVMEPARPGLDYEPVASMATYLTRWHGLTVMTLPAPSSDSPFTAMLNRDLARWSRRGGPYLLPYRRQACVSVMFQPGRAHCAIVSRP
jgi:hypothetical protein